MSTPIIDNRLQYLPPEEYKSIIDRVPVLCVDVVLKTTESRYVLFKRTNEPLKEEWWVLGGRVWKGESLLNAAARKVFEEARLVFSFHEYRHVGYYEEVFSYSALGIGPYHTISIVFEVSNVDPTDIKLDPQHTDWTTVEILPLAFRSKLKI